MTKSDRYDNALSTSSDTARDAYIEGVDLVLTANYGAEEAFRRAVAADDRFALGYAALARASQIAARGGEAREAMAKAEDLAAAGGLTDREKSHIAAMSLLIAGDGAGALKAMRAHVDDHPRDVLIAQPCTSVFGLIGFSGQPGREAEQLAFLNNLSHAYGDDWWYRMALAFAQCEVGQIAPSIDNIERSLAVNPNSAHGAHVRAHVYYENGETDAGYKYISGWHEGYDKRAPLHCHVSWHVALWALERGETERAWQIVDQYVRPASGTASPPINVLSDMASFLMRAELAGEPRKAELWQEVSAYAKKIFPNPAIAFADVHAALAHAIAGDGDALEKVIKDAKGPAGNLVKQMSEAFRAFARQSWAEAVALLTPVMASHERIGGSRAQRDLLEFMYAGALLRQDHGEEAKRLIMMRRPAKFDAHPVAGL